jgi:hypothetical protein
VVGRHAEPHAEGTANPDFSHVEADASQFTYDPRAALFFPEKRPFFLDGAELFRAPNNSIYTRQIAAPVAAVKLTGEVAGTDIALLSAADDVAASVSGLEHPVFKIVQLQHNLRGASKVGLAYTDRIDGTNSNRVLAGDARLQSTSIYDVQLQAGASRTGTNGATSSAPVEPFRIAVDDGRAGSDSRSSRPPAWSKVSATLNRSLLSDPKRPVGDLLRRPAGGKRLWPYLTAGTNR